MQAIVKTAPGPGFDYTGAHPDRPVERGEVRIEVAAASLCGTDRELVRHSPAAEALGLSFPVVLGHEVAGTVVEAGPSVETLQLGDRVALESHLACRTCYHCRRGQGHNCVNMALLGLHVHGGFAERLVVSEHSCFTLPGDVATETGALFEPAGVAVHALLRSEVNLAGHSVLIAGAGPVGLALAQLANSSAARRTVVVEPNAFRRSMAESFGAVALDADENAVDWCLADADDRCGFDVGFDCAGSADALEIVLRSLRREATAVCVGVPKQSHALDITRYLIKHGITLKGSFGRSLWQTWDVLAALASRRQLDLDSLVTHRVGLSGFQDALDLQAGDAGKVLLIPDAS
ncbi:threonine 3-dehydrogenase [Saccharopolyspora lacisalsi]|uniref:Threonine 3-dehydrogenase n=1 Tax=Halosaccharopolyspora lacisalsi TaxID=1000566 RepID=A0A839DT17_9PSEU|nr:alcohol dehydrogenase catalytic domain-containing protein [Halosaccharopolyspora lacisalsi]MBA8824090.1 threonine 3-dehydrogenase [Halosaccharopolyspora lacisalsi]